MVELWRLLEQDRRITDTLGRVQRRIRPAGRRSFFLGVETPSRNRMLILRVAESSAEELPDIPDSRGLNVRATKSGDTSNTAEIVLTLTELQHRDIFDLLIRDLVDAADHPQNEREGLVRFLARLSDWQQLLRRLGSRGLTREAQQGLWAELWVLREIVAPFAGLGAAVNAWRGPMGSNQDFQLGRTCLEVKSSIATTLDQLLISNERQLEVPSEVVLVLLGLSLDGRPGYGETLPELIESVRAKASDSACQHLLDHRLEMMGYLTQDADRYLDIGYSVRSLHPFRVEEGFPKIVSGDLQLGIGEVQYTLSTAACERFQIAFERPRELLEASQ